MKNIELKIIINLEDIMILERIKEILVEELDVEEGNITLESKIKDDLGADSLDLFELISKIEDELDVTIEEEDYAKLVTVGNIVDYISEKKN
jgi:acyl carrier protein